MKYYVKNKKKQTTNMRTAQDVLKQQHTTSEAAYWDDRARVFLVLENHRLCYRIMLILLQSKQGKQGSVNNPATNCWPAPGVVPNDISADYLNIWII